MKKIMNKLLKSINKLLQRTRKFWCKEIGRRFQRVPYEVWVRQKTGLLSNLKVSDFVPLKEETPRNEWLMGVIDATISDTGRVTGSVKSGVGKMNGENFIQVLVRPISKLILLLENKDGQFPGEET